jgi:hypothetical protein
MTTQQDLDDYARHSRYSDPGPHTALLDPLPADIRGLTAVVRNVIVHYRAAGITFTGDRLAEIDNRWLEAILATDQRRFAGEPLDAPRPLADRVAGCCRDFTLLTVAALRHQGVPARSKVGFATYFAPDFNFDHVIAEYWNGERWVSVDAQLDPGQPWPFDTCDMPPSPFEAAAQVWTAFRKGEIDVDRYGIYPGAPISGAGFVRNYVLQQLAHRRHDELLLWDGWGVMGDDFAAAEPEGDLDLIDEVAALLLAADDGDESAEHELTGRYVNDSRLNPGDRVQCHSPSGHHTVVGLR